MQYTDDMETIGYLKLLVNGTIFSLPFKFWHFFGKILEMEVKQKALQVY